MLNEKSINMIVSTPTFIHSANRLSYQLKWSRQDASEFLIIELLEHRLKCWKNEDVQTAVENDLPSLKWRIKYAAKDCYRRESRDDKREQEKAQMLSNVKANENIEQSEQALALIPTLFSNSQTRDWVQSVLTVGKLETMNRFGQTERQFCGKLAKVCKYANEHRQKTGELKMRQLNDNDMRELEIWNQWEKLIVFEPDKIQQFINQHRSMFDKVVDSPLIKQQGVLLDDFENADVSDKRQIIVLIKKHVAELEHKLTKRMDD